MAKPHMNLITIGHVDHGKSTLVGRLLFDKGFVKEEDITRVLSQQYGVPSVNLSKIEVDGAVVKLIQYFLRGHGSWVRIHGSRGQMENLRVGDPNMLRVRREQYHEKRAGPVEQIYLPDFPEHADEARRAGHGGGDFFMNYHFAQAIRTGKPPFMDVYRGVAMSFVGILAWRSALDGSNTVDVPDFRRRSVRDEYRHDDWNPDPTKHRPGDPWPSVLGKLTPTREQLAYARKIWRTASL